MSRNEAPRGWQLFHHTDDQSDGWEYLLYSDSVLLGTMEASVGPFTFFLTGASPGPQPTGQLILRIPHANPHPEQTGEEWPESAIRRRDLWLGLRRFQDFAARYRPDPPETRPDRPECQVDWDQLDEAVRVIYNYRSNVLHEGTPFPPMMTDALVDHDANGIPADCPDNTAIYSVGGAAWPVGAAPLHLWFFADLVRNTLLKWCAEAATSTS